MESQLIFWLIVKNPSIIKLIILKCLVSVGKRNIFLIFFITLYYFILYIFNAMKTLIFKNFLKSVTIKINM